MLRSLLVLGAIAGSCAFAPSPVLRSAGARTQQCGVSMRSARAAGGGSEARPVPGGEGAAERRGFLRLAAGAAVAAAFGGAAPFEAGAEVFFDTERYGDKELKVALINQVKQQFRALIEKKPDLIVPLFKLAIADALTYDPKTEAGGLNGGIMKKMDVIESANLKLAFDEVERIRNTLLQRTEVSNSDLIAFAGSVAIEATGGPRVKVQLGRIDGKKPSPPSNIAKWDQKNPTSEGIKAAFMSSGLTAQETVLLAGTVGQLSNAGTAMATALANKVVCNPDEDDDCNTNEEGDFGLYSPVTIVSETNRQFGRNRGASAVNSNVGFDSARIAGLAGEAKFSNDYLASLAKNGPKDKLGEALLGDEELKKWVMEYGKSNTRKFNKDAVSAYLKMVELGRKDTSR